MPGGLIPATYPAIQNLLKQKSLMQLHQAFKGPFDPMVYLEEDTRLALFLLPFPAFVMYKNLLECEYPSFHPSLAGIVYSASANINFLSVLAPVFSTLFAYI
jgi:hypothetical protein